MCLETDLKETNRTMSFNPLSNMYSMFRSIFLKTNSNKEGLLLQRNIYFWIAFREGSLNLWKICPAREWSIERGHYSSFYGNFCCFNWALLTVAAFEKIEDFPIALSVGNFGGKMSSFKIDLTLAIFNPELSWSQKNSGQKIEEAFSVRQNWEEFDSVFQLEVVWSCKQTWTWELPPGLI